MLYFNAKADNGVVLLDWGTASEQNNDYFLIERTSDGVEYEVIGKVGGSGTSVNVNKYSFVDYSPLDGEAFYRIRQVDFDGESEFTKWRKVNIDGVYSSAVASMNLYPNPATTGSTINYELSGFNAGEVTLTLQNQLGEVVYTKVTSSFSGSISLSEISKAGIYFVTFTQEGQKVSTKLVVY